MLPRWGGKIRFFSAFGKLLGYISGCRIGRTRYFQTVTCSISRNVTGIRVVTEHLLQSNNSKKKESEKSTILLFLQK